jgi:hypothetical protein
MCRRDRLVGAPAGRCGRVRAATSILLHDRMAIGYMSVYYLQLVWGREPRGEDVGPSEFREVIE